MYVTRERKMKTKQQHIGYLMDKRLTKESLVSNCERSSRVQGYVMSMQMNP